VTEHKDSLTDKNLSNKKLIFVFSSATSYRLQKYVIDRAIDKGCEVVMLFTGSGGAFFSEVMADAEARGVMAIALEDEVSNAETEGPMPRLQRSFKQTIILLLLRVIKPQPWPIREILSHRLRVCYKLLEQHRADNVICSEDGISSDLVLLSAARLLGLPIIDIPFGNGTVSELDYDLDRKSKEGRLITPTGIKLFLLRWLAPQWLKKGRHRGATMFEPQMIFAMESLGISLRDSWIIHGGLSDILCVENEVAHRQYKDEGIPVHKLKLTGSPYCDVIYESVKEAKVSFKKVGRLDKEVTKVLVSWPPSYHDTYPGVSEFETYEVMTQAVFSSLGQLPNIDLTISVHPACDKQTMDFIKKLGFSISSRYIINLIPLHDVFFTYCSSTIRWALASGKLVFNYDAYKLGIKTYDGAPGFNSHEKFSNLSGQMSELLANEAAFEEMMALQISRADEWGMVDGDSVKRIFNEIKV
jgi:hypothetical protein